MTRNKKLGLFLLIAPFALLFFILIAYAVSNFAFRAHPPEVSTQLSSVEVATHAEPDVRSAVANILNVVLGLAGLLAVIGIFVGVPLGIYFLTKKNTELPIGELKKQDLYKGLTDEQIKYINGWSWGAFFGNGIWQWGQKLYLQAVLAFIPFVNIYIWIKCAMDGRKMAWEKGGWDGFENFKKRQTVMAWVIVIVFVFVILSDI